MVVTNPPMRGRPLSVAIAGVAVALVVRVVLNDLIPASQTTLAAALAAAWIGLALTHRPTLGSFWRNLWLPVVLAITVAVGGILQDLLTIPQAGASLVLGGVAVAGAFVVGHART